MRPFWALTLYLAAVFAGGALLAPWLYWLANGSGVVDAGKGVPFHRIVNRSLLLVAVCGLWPLAYYTRLDSWRSLGLGWPRGWTFEWRRGFVVGLLSVALVALGGIVAEARGLRLPPDVAACATALAGAAGTALLVSVLEEVLFRGVIFGALRQVYHWTIALLASSVLYSLVHFLAKPTVAPASVHWASGFLALPEMGAGMVDGVASPAFVVLLLAGAVFASAYERRGTLYFSIGLHAGWIFWQKVAGIFTRPQSSGQEWLWGTSRLSDGWFAGMVLAFLLIAVLCVPPPRNRSRMAALGNIEAARRVRERVPG